MNIRAITQYVLFIALASLVGVSCAEQGRNVTSPPKRVDIVGPITNSQPRTVVEPVVIPPQVVVAPATPVVAPHRIIVLPVPFTVQAPHANWDLPYQEACEEASMIMVVDYVTGRSGLRLSPDEADKRILELVAWEGEHGYPIDVTAEQVVSILSQRFGIVAQVIPFDATRLRAELAAKRPVILPAAGRSLGNPYFHQPGPLYHMLVVKGYDGNEFITNDPGTRRGESFRYNESTFLRAVHDWNGGEVEKGEQVMIVVHKENI